MASRSRFAALLLLTSVVLAGCRSAAAATTSAQPTTLPTSACNGHAASGTFTVSIPSGGVQRTVLVPLPAGFADRARVALVLNMHGSGSTAVQQAGLSGMDAAADRDGFIVAYPQGAITSGSGYDWNVHGKPFCGGGA